jgi:hypothetical protein
MNAATPPRRWASAMTCWQIVVLPDDSGPKISVIRPRGMPPTPSARSSAIEPVGMKSTCCRAAEPSFMIDPVPNCFSIARIAASTALPLSAVARAPLPPLRSLVIAMGLSRSCRSIGRSTERTFPASDRGSALFRFLFLDLPRLALLPDQLDVLRRLRQGCELRRAGLLLRLLLRFAMRAISRAHRMFLRVETRLAMDASRQRIRDFTATQPAGALAQF